MNLPTLSIPLAIVPPKPSFASISVKICGCSLCRAVDKANTAAAAMPIPAAIFFPFDFFEIVTLSPSAAVG